MADAADSKSAEGNLVRVRLSPRALYRTMTYTPYFSIRRKGFYPGCAPFVPPLLPSGKRAYPVPSREVAHASFAVGYGTAYMGGDPDPALSLSPAGGEVPMTSR